VRTFVCHTQHSAKAVGRNEMSFGRDTRVAPINTVLDGAPVAQGKARFASQDPVKLALQIAVKPLQITERLRETAYRET